MGDNNSVLVFKVVCAFFVIVGTYILSRGVFEQKVKRLINFEFQTLPWCFKFVIICFGYKAAFISKALWDVKEYPMTEKLSLKTKMEEISPFLGFLFVFIGTLLALVIN